jgi:hypothetical protein
MSEKREVSRAESARRRRAREKAKRMEQASRRAYNPGQTAPVRVRRYVAPKPTRSPTDRIFNIALGVLPGVNTRKPQTIELPQLRAGSRTISLVLSLALFTTLISFWVLPYFHATWATVIGNNRVTPEEINSGMGLAGQSIFTIQPEEVETRLRRNYPELTAAKVRVYLPNRVYVTVAEREPLILWQQGEGYTWIDANGVAFRPRGSAPGLIPVLANGTPPAGLTSSDDPLSPPAYLSAEMVNAILVLAPNVPPGDVLTYNPQNGLGWTDPRGWEVYFGTDPKDMALKVRVYQTLVDSLLSEGKQPIFISVEYADAPYYRTAEPETEGNSSGE